MTATPNHQKSTSFVASVMSKVCNRYFTRSTFQCHRYQRALPHYEQTQKLLHQSFLLLPYSKIQWYILIAQSTKLCLNHTELPPLSCQLKISFIQLQFLVFLHARNCRNSCGMCLVAACLSTISHEPPFTNNFPITWPHTSAQRNTP